MNSEVIHLTAANASGPYSYADTALAPRMDKWDNGAVHGAASLILISAASQLFS
jgi:hypothetical protein